MGSIKGIACVFLLVSLIFIALPASLSAQNTAAPTTLSAELSRLQAVAVNSARSTTDRLSAFLLMGRLNQLSGDSEAALKAYEGALVLAPDNGRALVTMAQFLISIGEHERADAALSALLARERERSITVQGQYLGALLAAFRSGNTRHLAAQADDPDFAAYRSGIYYTLWRITGVASWERRLVTEFPQSPEAKIASGDVRFPATPLWFLFNGRSDFNFADAASHPAESQAQVQPSPPTAPARQPAPAGNAQASSGRLLQAGLFTQEANASALAQRLRSSGFQPLIVPRQLNGRNHFAVCVHSGADVNAMLARLKSAGFDAFPLP